MAASTLLDSDEQQHKKHSVLDAESDKKNLAEHWDAIYANNKEDQLGWFENDLQPSLKLIEEAELNSSSRILNVGAGSTRLIDRLSELGYCNLIATDLSAISLDQLRGRVGEKVTFIHDDLTKPTQLNNIKPVDLWIDRAVLHFFTKKAERTSYFRLLNKLVKRNGYVLLAQFALDGANMCSGLPIHQYSTKMMLESLGSEFNLLDSFEYLYIMPSGDSRPYIYALFKRN